MKCSCCGAAELIHDTRDVPYVTPIVLFGLRLWHCRCRTRPAKPRCGVGRLRTGKRCPDSHQFGSGYIAGQNWFYAERRSRRPARTGQAAVDPAWAQQCGIFEKPAGLKRW